MKSKEQKRIEAAERQEHYDRLTTAEKLQQIEDRPGESRRERERLSNA